MPRAKSLFSGLIGVALLVLLAFVGNWAGHRVARSGLLHRSAIQGKPSTPDLSAPSRPRPEPARGGELASVIKSIRALARTSPILEVDWEAIARIDGMISKLTASELEELYSAIDPTTRDNNSWFLSRKIGAAWAAKDPEAALKAALAKHPASGRVLAREIYQDWAMDAPGTALAWLNEADLPPSLADLKDDLRHAALWNLAERDFALASSELLKIPGSTAPDSLRTRVLSEWAAIYADDPAMRGQLVDFAKSTGRPEDYAELNRSLLSSWPQEESLGMLNYLLELRDYLETDAIPAGARPAVDAAAVGAAIGREYTRPALEWWMERYAESPETPEPLRQAVADWTRKHPDEMRQWFDEQPDSPQRNALRAASVPAFISQEKYAEAAQSLADVRDPKLRQPLIERLDLFWTAQDPAAAAAWRTTLPQE